MRNVPEKKKNEITIGFTPHFPSFVEKELPLMKKADLILVELPHGFIMELSRGTSPKILAQYTNAPEIAEKELIQIKKLMDEGKAVMGYETWEDPDAWTPKELKKVEKIKKGLGEEGARLRTSPRYSQLFAEEIKLRDSNTLKIIRKITSKISGKKIYINAGTAHTRIWHELKKHPGKNMEVKAEFLERGKIIPSKVIFSPDVEEMRMHIFGVAEKNPDKMKRLQEQMPSYSRHKGLLQMKYMLMGLTREQAKERATYETLKKVVSKRRLRR